MGLRDRLGKLFGKRGASADQVPAPAQRAGRPVPVPPAEQQLDVKGAVDAFLAEFIDRTGGSAANPLRWREAYYPKPAEYADARAVLEADRTDQVRALRYAFKRLGRGAPRNHLRAGDVRYGLTALARQLLRRKLPYSDEDLVALLDMLSASKHYLHELPWGGLLGAVSKHLADRAAEGELRKALRRAEIVVRERGKGGFSEGDLHADAAKLVVRVQGMLRSTPDDRGPLIEPGKPWADAAIAELAGMAENERRGWDAVLAHAKRATASKPSKKWLKEARALIAGADSVATRLSSWFDGVAETPNLLIQDGNATLLRGLAWMTVPLDDDELTRSVGSAAASCYRKIEWIGPRAPKVGNACVLALSLMESREAVAQLVRLRSRAKHASTRARIEKAIRAAAERAGLGEVELEEIATPTFGMEEVGLLRVPVGEFTAVIAVTGTVSAELSWRTPAGKPQKSVPKAVREDHADELKALKKTLKDLRAILPAQRHRLERLLMPGFSRDVTTWRERYLDQPLIGSLARRLIWTLDDRSGGVRTVAWLGDGLGDGLVDANDAPAEPRPDETARPWHPIESDVPGVVAWREWLLRHEVTQPFKQAHREVYVLTDAERGTATYSNRFAAHILRQHQFAALCRTRGWLYTLQGQWDSHNTPTLVLPRHGLTVEYWVEGDWDTEEVSESGVFMTVATDQVRFYRTGEQEPLPLTDVPPLLFSEVMRDVDLFVGVCSIGADPAWGDRDAYWQQMSFGELNAAATTRREVLERLLPKLRIAEHCRLDGKFLRVEGKHRSYKIHLGSGNILMEPNDAYLCIVPQRGTAAKNPAGKLFLPFEGDGVLAVILSKAFLLAADDKIKDRTILSQLKR